MIYIGNNEISNIYVGTEEIFGIYAGDLQIYPTDYGILTGITFSGLTWETDVPASGGTADSGNCSFRVIALYDSGKMRNVTSHAQVSGYLVVPSTTAETREMVGTLTLTASYEGFTATDSVDVYQKRHYDCPVSITTNNAIIEIGYTANTSTRIEAQISCTSTADNYGVMGSNGVWHSQNSYYLSIMRNGSYRFYVGASYHDNALTGITAGQLINAYLSTTSYTFTNEDGVVLSTSAFTSNYQPIRSFTIGNVNGNNTVGAVNTFYYVKIYEGNTLVRDLIPWVDDNGHGCLKDILTDTVYNANDPSRVTPNYE